MIFQHSQFISSTKCTMLINYIQILQAYLRHVSVLHGEHWKFQKPATNDKLLFTISVSSSFIGAWGSVMVKALRY